MFMNPFMNSSNVPHALMTSNYPLCFWPHPLTHLLQSSLLGSCRIAWNGLGSRSSLDFIFGGGSLYLFHCSLTIWFTSAWPKSTAFRRSPRARFTLPCLDLLPDSIPSCSLAFDPTSSAPLPSPVFPRWYLNLTPGDIILKCQQLRIPLNPSPQPWSFVEESSFITLFSLISILFALSASTSLAIPVVCDWIGWAPSPQDPCSNLNLKLVDTSCLVGTQPT